MQTPPPFGYERATSVEHAVALLEQLGPEARLVAGGHSLLPMMKLRLARPEHLVDINDLAEQLGYVRVEGDELCIGAMTRHAELLDSAVAGEHYPHLPRRRAGHRRPGRAQPRHRRRLDRPGRPQRGPLRRLRRRAGRRSSIQGTAGTRTVPAREFHAGPYETAVGPAEMITEIRVPIRPGGGSAYRKVERRAGDWAVAAAGACVWLDGDTVSEVGIGLTAVGAEQFCSPAAEESLRGEPATDEAIAAAAALAAEHCDPSTDQRGPAEYKRHLAGELTKRALHAAVARARGEETSS